MFRTVLSALLLNVTQFTVDDMTDLNEPNLSGSFTQIFQLDDRIDSENVWSDL